MSEKCHNYVFQLLEKCLLIGVKHYYLILLCELNHHPRITAERLLLGFVESSDVVDCVCEEVSHVQQQFSFDCDDEVVDKFKHVPDSFLMGSDGSFFGVGHVFPCFISDQQRNTTHYCFNFCHWKSSSFSYRDSCWHRPSLESFKGDYFRSLWSSK